MSEEDRLLLNKLSTNVQKLFQEFEKLGAENEILKGRAAVLTQEIARIELERSDLLQKNEKLILANRILAGNDKEGEAKGRLDKLIREIDKCIALLNK